MYPTNALDNKPYLKKISISFIIFYSIACVFPVIRLWTLGNNNFKNFYEYAFGSLPDILLIVIILYTSFVFFNNQRYKIIKRNIYDIFLLCFILSNLIIGFFLSKANIYYFASGFRTFYLPIFAYFIGRSYFGNSSLLKKFIDSVFFVITLLGILGLTIYFIFPSWQSVMIQYSGHEASAYFILRITSLLLSPVIFGTLISWAMIYYYYQILNENRFWYYLFYSICSVCLILTVSRGPIVTFLLGFIILTLIHRKWKIALYVLIIFTIVSILISIISEGDLRILKWIIISSADTIGLGKSVTRVELWIRSYHDFKRSPQGYGIGRSGNLAHRHLLNSKDAAPYTTDGWYLKMLCETGLYGLLSYLFLAGYYFYKVGSNIIKRENKGIITMIFVLFLMVNIENIFSNVLDFSPYVALYWLCIGISINELNLNEQQPRI
jgi:hypothetical protein